MILAWLRVELRGRWRSLVVLALPIATGRRATRLRIGEILRAE